MVKLQQIMKFCESSTVNGVVAEKNNQNQKRRSYEKI
jgi:hypothetical protein